MTREKAIEKLKNHKCHIDGQDKCQWVTEGFGNCDDCEIGVAIKALEQEPILNKTPSARLRVKKRSPICPLTTWLSPFDTPWTRRSTSKPPVRPT